MCLFILCISDKVALVHNPHFFTLIESIFTGHNKFQKIGKDPSLTH